MSQFRSWSYRTLSIHPSLQYVHGPNGSGKTSLLESIGFLSNGRSVRTHRDRECVQHGCNSFSIRGQFTDTEFESVSLQYSAEKSNRTGKIVKVDGDPLPRLSQLQRLVTTIYFSSEDLLTLKEGPSRRRRLMNDVLSRLDPDYVNHLRQYQKALNQRNSLLKKPTPDEVLLESIEETMAESGSYVMEQRRKLFPTIQPDLIKEHAFLADDESESLSVEYNPSIKNTDHFLSELTEERDRAKQRGYTTIGPQRDDWMIELEGHPAGRYSSQGELRTLVFALKFALAKRIMEGTDQWPIMLFDDMVSDLDSERIRRCLDRARERPFQLIFTGTRSLADESLIDEDCQLTLRVG